MDSTRDIAWLGVAGLVEFAVRLGLDPGEILAEVNRIVLDSGVFDSALLLVLAGDINPQTGRVRFCNAGHPAPLLQDRGETSPVGQDQRSLPLGLDSQLDYQTILHDLEPDSTLLFLSDGVMDCMSGDNQMFPTEKIYEALSEHSTCPSTLLNSIIDQQHAFRGDASSFIDSTLFAMRRIL
jgi:sigma-B regulation protein RsbU (phosphoserine phosphatase)